MVRFDEATLFDRLAKSGKLEPRHLDDAARTIAEFHKNAPVLHSGSGADAIGAVLSLNETAFAELPAQQREAVVLHKLEGWSFTQIAQAFDISETAARIRAHRGYEKLRELLGDLA